MANIAIAAPPSSTRVPRFTSTTLEKKLDHLNPCTMCGLSIAYINILVNLSTLSTLKVSYPQSIHQKAGLDIRQTVAGSGYHQDAHRPLPHSAHGEGMRSTMGGSVTAAAGPWLRGADQWSARPRVPQEPQELPELVPRVIGEEAGGGAGGAGMLLEAWSPLTGADSGSHRVSPLRSSVSTTPSAVTASTW